MSLDYVTETRVHNSWLIYFLPFAGILISYTYQKFGKSVEAGNNLLIDEIHTPNNTIPLRTTPLILLSTLGTHLFGGSAGREGTAVQMSGSIADQFTSLFKMNQGQRKLVLIAGVSAGFAAAFGTPLAGAIFGIEVLSIGRIKRLRFQAVPLCLMASLIADFVCNLWGVKHSHFTISSVPAISWQHLLWSGLAGASFGICAFFFARMSHRLTDFFKVFFRSPILRTFAAGVLIIALCHILETHRYLGLGISVIGESFTQILPPTDFILKMLFTIITLSAGFKGGEVTPLFFVGATLGSSLAALLPLPTSLLAGMGFVAVFAGAANTPLACSVMALELFGMSSGIYTAIACFTSYALSGHSGIYKSQRIEARKYGYKN